MAGPAKKYSDLVEAGKLQSDEAQVLALTELSKLFQALENYSPAPRRLFRKPPPPPPGLYIWGGVGGGKSLLMDLFFEDAPLLPKRRVHFHEFMAETHAHIAGWRKMSNQARKKTSFYSRHAELDDPIPHIAKRIFNDAHLLCFDEFQVADIADAMILGRLFQHLFTSGAIVVATSNRHPDDLYKDGLNRQLFLPFIELLKERLNIHQLGAAKDYRLDQLTGVPVYYQPLGASANSSMDDAWLRLIMGGIEQEEELTVRGRRLLIPCAARGAARADFAHLCSTALGAEDYLAIAQNYNTLFLDNIPILTPENRNEAKRFVTLIDALYEHRCKLVCSAAAPPQELYVSGDGSFEFERTVSRLMEMQSVDYLAKEHVHKIAC